MDIDAEQLGIPDTDYTARCGTGSKTLDPVAEPVAPFSCDLD